MMPAADGLSFIDVVILSAVEIEFYLFLQFCGFVADVGTETSVVEALQLCDDAVDHSR